MNVLVIDIGTSSMRGILFSESGKKLAAHQIKYQPDKLPDGRIEQNPADWICSLEKITSEVVKAANKQNLSIDALAVTSQRSSIIPVDRTGKPLMNTIMWQDGRNAELCKELEPFNRMIFERSGARINTVFSGSRMMWIRRNCPKECRELYKFVNIPEYVLHHMTGEYVTDTTYGSRSHLMNLREKRWDPELLNLFEVQENELCTLQEPGSEAGRVTAAFAQRTGLQAGVPVITAGGDQQCAAIGQGAYREGNLSLVAGTGGFLVAAVEKVPENLDSRLICNCSSVRGHYMIEANVLTCCSAFDWYCRNFYDWETPFDGRRHGKEVPEKKIDYDRINQELQELDGWISTALVLPYFQGRSTPEWNPEARAVIGEISLNTDRKEILKGLLEGICMEIQNNIRLFGSYTNIDKAYISGGLTNSSSINQLQADIYGIPLYHMEDSESTALGALMVALEGLGRDPSLEAAFQRIRSHTKTRCYEPRVQYYEAYANKRAKMNRLYDRIFK